MAISTELVKLMASQKLTDDSDGGGFMTGNEVVDGNINNLFSNISRLDKTVGRVSLRKASVLVDTADTETYSGCHVIISEKAHDDLIKVCLFETGDPSDVRSDARNRLESYSTLGPIFQGRLWGDQPAGATSLLIYQPESAESPEVGAVLCLFNGKDTVTEQYQYVRLTKVSTTIQTFQIIINNSLTTITKKVVNATLSDPLEYTFSGDEIYASDVGETSIYTTIVSNSAKYYGVMTPTSDIDSGATVIPVDSIYTQLVPTSQIPTSMVDLNVGTVTNEATVGDRTIDVAATPTTAAIRVFSASRGTNYVAVLKPYPYPGTISVDFMAEGSWYRLNDEDGILVPEISNTGTGRVNYETGSIMITTGALPDVDTPILITWGNPSEIVDLTGTVDIVTPAVNGTLLNFPVAPNSVSFSWPSGLAVTATATDDGNGTLMEDGAEVGWINYGNGEYEFTPTALPISGADISVDYEKYAPQSGEVSGSSFTLPGPIEPGTVALTIPLTFGPITYTYNLRDDGFGELISDGFAVEVYSSTDNGSSSSSSSSGETSSNSGWSLVEDGDDTTVDSSSTSTSATNTVTVQGGALFGTIDYVTGSVVIDNQFAVGRKTIIKTRTASQTTIDQTEVTSVTSSNGYSSPPHGLWYTNSGGPGVGRKKWNPTVGAYQ